jgi:ElaA protein
MAAAAMLQWQWARMQDMGVQGLYDALALRQRVFILEQGPYMDLDGNDARSWHLLGRDAAGTPQAYLRVVDPGIRFAEPSIGRVVTSPEVRGTGQGHVLVREGVVRCEAAWPGRGIRISAQAHLERFYAAHGFARVREPHIEDGIPHLEMARRA